MDYEKKYKEALEKARQLCAYPTTKPFINDLQDLFPELAESEDERIRKAIIEYLRQRLDRSPSIPAAIGSWIAWLEKQGEQKPAWSEEDECYMSECIGAIATKDGWSFEEKRKTKHWLKSLKQRIGG